MSLNDFTVSEAIIYGTLEDVKQFPIQDLKEHRFTNVVFTVLNRTFSNTSPLILAILAHRIEIIVYLLENKFPINSLVSGTTALHVACYLNYYDIVDTLLFYGASPLTIDDKLMNPLSVAVTYGYNEIIESLLQCDYSPQALSLPLQIAIYNNNVEVVGKLVLCGADASIENVSKKKPIDVLRQEQEEIANILKNTKPLPKINSDGKDQRMALIGNADSLSALSEGIEYNFKPKNVIYHKLTVRSKI